MRTITPPGQDAHTPKPRPAGRRRTEPYYFVVRGRGWFPDDMLRYDQAWAVTGTTVGGDQAMMLGVQQTERSVIVASWRHELTDRRWASFGWGVIERLKERPNFLPPPE